MWDFWYELSGLEAREILAGGIGMLDSEIESGETFWTDGEAIGMLFGWKATQSEKVKMPKGLLRKERVLVIPIIHLMGILTGKAKIWLPDEVPADSIPLRTFQDESSHAICIVVGHSSFKPVESGFQIPKSEVKVSYPDLIVAPREPEPAETPEVDETIEREI